MKQHRLAVTHTWRRFLLGEKIGHDWEREAIVCRFPCLCTVRSSHSHITFDDSSPKWHKISKRHWLIQGFLTQRENARPFSTQEKPVDVLKDRAFSIISLSSGQDWYHIRETSGTRIISCKTSLWHSWSTIKQYSDKLSINFYMKTTDNLLTEKNGYSFRNLKYCERSLIRKKRKI